MAKLSNKENKLMALSPEQIKELAEAFDNNVDLAMFFTQWVSNGHNATEAYMTLYPSTSSREVAQVMGSRWLSKIDMPVALGIYNLGMDRYLTVIDEGLKAKQEKVMTTKAGNTIDMSGDDWDTKKYFHEKLGRLLGVEIESKNAGGLTLNLNQQINQAVDTDRKQYE